MATAAGLVAGGSNSIRKVSTKTGGTMTIRDEGDQQRVSYDGDCFPSIEAYSWSPSSGAITQVMRIPQKGPWTGNPLAGNCKFERFGQL